jgi:hypothetical protein
MISNFNLFEKKSWKINGPKLARLCGKKKVYKTPDFYDKFY